MEQELYSPELGVCDITGQELPKRYLRVTEDHYHVDTALHCEATIALKSCLLTKKELDTYFSLKTQFKDSLTLTARIMRKMSVDRAELEEVKKWYKVWEEEQSQALFGRPAQCMDMFEHLILLNMFEAEYGWIDEKVAIAAELSVNGGSIPVLIAHITSGHKYTDWVAL